MPTFIQTGKMTQSTIVGLVDKPEDRFQAVSDIMAAAGATLKDYYFTTGENDWLMILEAESADASAITALVAGAFGAAADVKTMQAWTSDEFKDLATRAAAIRAGYRAPGN